MIREYLTLKTGSMPLDVPAIILKVPVGAMVVVVAFLRGMPFFSHVLPR